MTVGILGAMFEEIAAIKQLMDISKETELGGRIYIEGRIKTQEVVLSFSRWGKVAAACTVATLIHRFAVDSVVFTGVAGAVHPKLNIGDIVIADGLYQHDMDARPIFSQYQIPLTDSILFKPAEERIIAARTAAETFLKTITQYIDAAQLAQCSVAHPQVYRGIVASGDQFIANPLAHQDLCYEAHGQQTLAVEMEGAAIAQVCHEHQIPYTVIRTISDKADHSAVVNFQEFAATIASQYSAGILNNYW